jgi:hypothetical protein
MRGLIALPVSRVTLLSSVRSFALFFFVAGALGACVSAYGTATEAPPDGGDAAGAADAPSSDASDSSTSNDGASGGDGSGADAPSGDASADAPDSSDAGALGCRGAVDCERVAFETSSTYTGSLGGAAGADALCQSRADASPLPRIAGHAFRAWISSTTASAASRHVHGTKPYVRSDMTVIATSYADLTDGTLAAALNRDEHGVAVGGGAWTDTTTTGSVGGAGDCAGWTTGSAAITAGYGSANNTDAYWTDFASTIVHCDLLMHLYCIEY